MTILQFSFTGDRGQAIGRVGATREKIRIAEWLYTPRLDQDSCADAQPAKTPSGENTSAKCDEVCKDTETLHDEWKTVHQALQTVGHGERYGRAHGSRRLDQRKGKGQGQRIGQVKDKGHLKSREAISDKSNMKSFFCKKKGHTRKDCPNFSAWLTEKKQVGHETSANAIEEAGGILP